MNNDRTAKKTDFISVIIQTLMRQPVYTICTGIIVLIALTFKVTFTILDYKTGFSSYLNQFCIILLKDKIFLF